MNKIGEKIPENHRKHAGTLYEFGRGIAAPIKHSLSFIYFLPTKIRKMNEATLEGYPPRHFVGEQERNAHYINDYDRRLDTGRFYGGCLGTMIAIPLIGLSCLNCISTNPKNVWVVPAITNAISATYEIVRRIARSKERDSSSVLEQEN